MKTRQERCMRSLCSLRTTSWCGVSTPSIKFATARNVEPIRYVSTHENDSEAEIFYVSKDSSGYKIQIISFKEGSTNPLATRHEDGSKILIMILRE